MSAREDGAAVVIALGMTALLITVALVGGGLAAIVSTHRQLEAAADLAALAGAASAQRGEAACASAERIATRNGGELTACEAEASVVLVVVERRLPRALGGRVLHARARAGPVAAPD